MAFRDRVRTLHDGQDRIAYLNHDCPTCNNIRTMNRRIRAIASEPGPDGKVIAVLEAPTAGALRVQIERTGLVTNTGHAIFLGGLLAAIERKL